MHRSVILPWRTAFSTGWCTTPIASSCPANPSARRKGEVIRRIAREVGHEHRPIDSQAAHWLVCRRTGGGGGADVAVRWRFQTLHAPLLRGGTAYGPSRY